MLIVERLEKYWKNTKEMPFLLRALVQGAMVVAPVFLLLLALPIAEWEIDGRLISYAELWSSGQGAAISVSLALICIGAWGLAARNHVSRWPLVFSPLAPYLVLVIFPWSPALTPEPITAEVIVGSAVAAAMFYVCLFHLRVVREYLDDKGVGA